MQREAEMDLLVALVQLVPEVITKVAMEEPAATVAEELEPVSAEKVVPAVLVEARDPVLTYLAVRVMNLETQDIPVMAEILEAQAETYTS